MGEAPSKVAYMLRLAKYPISLELPVGEGEDVSIGDFIEDEEMPTPEEATMQNLLNEHLREILDTLPPREVRVLQLRYGLRGNRMHTLYEVGNKMGITRERVRQIQSQALRRLRAPARRIKLVDYMRS